MEHSHLKRLANVWTAQEVYFITTCTAGRQPLLACVAAMEIITAEWATAEERHGWKVGRFMIMPDHLHFFCAPMAAPKRNLSGFVGAFKQWTAKRLTQSLPIAPPLWQPEFFDHLLRSPSSYSEKWDYVRMNPVRAGLVATPEQWPWQGEIESFSL